MSCLKCGQEVSPGQVFCDSCLADMEQHPVKPGTPVIIPKRSKPLPAKRSHKRLQKPEDQISALRRLVGWLLVLIVILTLAVAVLTLAALHYKDIAENGTHNRLSAVQIVSRETNFDSI